jgi:DNA-binding response OmpR family regulator
MSEREGGSHAVTRVLIVDDHRSFADALELVLRSTLAGSPRCSCAASVAEGLRLVSQGGPYDLAVVDLMLPDGNGTTVVGEIKRRSPGTPVAVLTASQDLSEALAAGADKAMPKTTPLEEMVACLVRLARIPDQPGTQDA